MALKTTEVEHFKEGEKRSQRELKQIHLKAHSYIIIRANIRQ